MVTAGWRLAIVHTTRVCYSGAARASYNEARMTPLTLPVQATLGSQVEVVPAGTPVWAYEDYWGTTVSSFDIQAPHTELVVTARAIVETRAADITRAPLGWEPLQREIAGGRLAEYLAPTARTTVTEDLAGIVRERTSGAEPAEAAAEIAALVFQHVSYVPGATGVQTGAQEAWDKGQGVCQDIAHLTVAMLRVLGLPARYVSGYLHPDPAASPGDTTAGQSHAWVEYWAGAWTPVDPTNRARVSERHVVVARGRDYADVPPLKGIYHGVPSSTMDVTVEVTRLA